MSNKQLTDEKEKPVPVEEIQEEDDLIVQEREIVPEDLEDILPQMVAIPDASARVELISDQQYLGMIDEIMNNIREDRKQVSDYIDNFADMVINDGDASTSSKEALVNLVKIKTDLSDKMAKTADLVTRLKVKNTYAHSGPHLNSLHNTFNINSEAPDFNRKELIRAINHAKKKIN